MTGPALVYALDFDGVICDSVNESSISAYKALSRVWPDLAGTDEQEPPAWFLEAMRAVRPIVETGYENVLLARAFVERGPGSDTDGFVQEVLTGDWRTIRMRLHDTWSVEKDALVEAFGSVRDEWIERDPDSWISANKFYPGVVDALNFSGTDLYILTTKQTRFVTRLLEAYGVRTVSEDRIFGYGTGSKVSVLKRLTSAPEMHGKKIVFVEDRYETLEEITLSLLGLPLELHLASWGYNIPEARETAEKHPFIQVTDLPTFVNKFQ